MKLLFAPVLALLAGIGWPASGGQVVINEIMYHPAPAVPEDNGLEWIELRNTGTNAVELQGWSFTRGVGFTFSNSTVLPAGGFLVVAADAGKFAARNPAVVNVTGPWQGALGNNGEEIFLSDAAGNEQDSVAYASEGHWAQRVRGPVDRGHQGWKWEATHDGEGKSLELIQAALSNEQGQNWGASLPDGGTPGAGNSIASGNIAPLILDARHTPAVPQSSDAVTITANILDESTNGLVVTLWYRVDAFVQTLNFSGIPMFDDGLHNDGGAGDGLFGVVLPAQTNNAVVEFYIQARDAGGRSRTYPAPVAPTGLQSANLLYQVDDSAPYAGNQPVYRLVMTQAEARELDDIGRNVGGSAESDAEMNGTFIVVGGAGTEVRYTCGFRNRGHFSRTARPNNFRVNIPNDARWENMRHLNLNSQFTHVQVFGSAIFQKAGAAAANSRPVQLRVNNANPANAGLRQFGSYAHNEELAGEFAENHYPLDDGGNVYRGVRDEDAPLAFAHLNYLGPAKTNCLSSIHDCYTNLYFKQSNLSADRWDDLIETTRVLGETPDAQYAAEARRVFDVEAALRYFAANALADNRETSLANGAGDDYGIYIPALDRRLKLIAYDMDTLFGQGDTAGQTNAGVFRMTNFFNANAPGPTNMIRFITHPEFTRLYYATLKHLAETTFAPTNFNAAIDRVLGDWVPVATVNAMKAWQAGRSGHVLAQIPTNITINSGLTVVSNYLRTTSATLTLDGRAHIIETHGVRVNGSSATWNHLSGRWTNTVTVQPGINRVLVQSFNAGGVEFERATVDVWYDTAAFYDVSGTLAADTTWTAAAGPFRVTANVVVPAGRTLTIEAGTTVHFAPGVGVTVNGILTAIGTETQRIRFTRVPGAGATNDWAGMTFSNSTVTNRLAFADIESAGSVNHSIGVVNAILIADHLTFSGTTRGLIELSNASLRVSDSVFPTISDAEHIYGGPIPANGYVIIERNIFGQTTGLNDIIDFTGAQRPGPILQVLDNVFTGATDDVLDLDGTDAHIEGNVFMHIHKSNAGVGDPASAISFGRDLGYAPHVVAVRNLFFDVDHVALAKEGGYITLINNTAVGIGIAAVNFSEPERNTLPAAGALLDGNIFWNPPGWIGTNIANRFPTNGSPSLSITRSIVPASDSFFDGPANLITDPRLAFTDTNAITWQNITSTFRLLAGSPASGTGPNGIDRGGLVPAGASIFGEPFSPTPRSGAGLLVGGPSISNYIWRVNGGAWSAERPVTTPIVLVGLGNGSHFVEVLGRNDAGVWQAAPTASRPWVVDTNASRVRLNEVLAWNRSSFIHQDTSQM